MKWEDQKVSQLLAHVTQKCIDNGGLPTLFTMERDGIKYFIEVCDSKQAHVEYVSGTHNPEVLH